jgi:hypothetical protein
MTTVLKVCSQPWFLFLLSYITIHYTSLTCLTSTTLKLEATVLQQTLVYIQQTTWHLITEYGHHRK